MNQPGISRGPLAAVLMVLLLASPGVAQEPTPAREHVVRRGDTLWDLAGTYLGNPFLWPMIYEGNRSVVEDPHWIYPGERLRIPGFTPAPVGTPLGEPVTAQPGPGQAPQPLVGDSPGAGGAGAVAMLDLRRPIITDAEYLASPWVASGAEAAVVGRVLRLVREPSTASDKIAPMLHPNYQVHVGAVGDRPGQVGDSLLIVRLGQELRGYGRVVEPLALVRVDSVTGAVLTGTVVAQFAEARVGDRLVRLEPRPEIPVGQGEPVSNGAEGLLLAWQEEQLLYGTGDAGFVAASSERLRLGDELAIYAAGGAGAPQVEVARARVVRVTPAAATVRLTGVFDTSVRAGLPVRVVARTP